MSKKNTFAINPPMGWNSWDCYGAGVTEDILKKNADFMAEHLKEFGWEYIVCDIQWYEPTANSSKYHDFADLCMDEYGRVLPAPNRFPSAADGVGFKAIAEYVHSKGLKFGIHVMRGIPRQAVHANLPIKGTDYTARQVANPASVCVWNSDMYGLDISRPGAQEYIDSVIELYVSWGVDYIKVDDICVIYARPNEESTLAYGGDEIELYRRAIDKVGRPIVLSISPGPAMPDKKDHLKKNANLWRITNDFWDDWRFLYDMFDRCETWTGVGEEGSWPDCDMLPIGHLSIIGEEQGRGDRYTRFTHDEQRTMITLWCIFRSPLMIGSELNDMDDWTIKLITNPEVLALNKDSRNAHMARRTPKHVVWQANDEAGNIYVAIFNVAGWTESIVLNAEDIEGLSSEEEYSVYDIWKQEEDGKLKGSRAFNIKAHDCRLIKLHK